MRYNEAIVTLEDREERIAAVSDEIERDLRLLGATAIEDRLQDGVPETIADLKTAGIKIWVATGDKLETAIGKCSNYLISDLVGSQHSCYELILSNPAFHHSSHLASEILISEQPAIGHSTNLISKESNMIIVRGDGSRPVWNQMVNAMQEFFAEEAEVQGIAADVDKQIPLESDDAYPLRRVNTGVTSIVGSDNGERPGGFVLVIDGAALNQASAFIPTDRSGINILASRHQAFSDQAHSDLLLTLATQCEGVICCRVSPLQKALIVRLVRDGLDAMTLAIGDGANDVSMIQVRWTLRSDHLFSPIVMVS